MFFLEKEEINDNAFNKLWLNLDLDNASFADVSIKIEGPNYDSSFRSDFAEGILKYQAIFNKQILFILGDDNPYRKLTNTEKEDLLFFVSVSKGCSNIKLNVTKTLVNVLAKKLSKMGPSQICLFLLLLAVIIQSPKFYETWMNGQLEQQKINILSKESDAKIKVLEKISSNDFLKSQLESPEFLEIRKNILDEIKLHQSRALNAIIKNTGEVSKIIINEHSYLTEEIEQIKNSVDDDVVPTISTIIKGQFSITSIDRFRYPILKLHLKPVGKQNPTVNATIDIRMDNNGLKSKNNLIWEYFEKGESLYFVINMTTAEDGKIKCAVIDDISVNSPDIKLN